MLKLFGSKAFKSWKAKSWIVQSLSRLEDMELPKKHFKTWDSKSWKSVRFQNCGCQVLKNISKWVHVLEDQVMKDIIHGKGLMLKFFTPKSFKTWKAKSWIVQSLSRLGDMGFKKCNISKLGFKVLKKCKISELWLPSLEKYFQMCSCLGRPSHERHNSWQGSNVESLYPKVSRLGKPSLE